MQFPRGDIGEISRLAPVISQALMAWKFGSPQDKSAALTRLRSHAQSVVWQARRTVEAVGGAGLLDDFIELLEKIAPNRQEIVNALKAWVNLVEVLVQDAEQEYGTARGRGKEKAEQVKAALVHIAVDRPGLSIPDVPDFLIPIIVETGVNWAINAIVLILNNNSLWEPAIERPPMRRSIFAKLIRALFAFGRWIRRLAPLARVSEWLRKATTRLVLIAYPLKPDVRIAVERIETTAGASIEDVLKRGVAVISWTDEHSKQVIALIEVIPFAVQEAEFFGGLSGPEKKVYARELIIAFLKEIGIIDDETSLTFHLIDSFLDWGIDAVVGMFNTRAESFGKRVPRTAASNSFVP